jgi:hypothetical protein
MLLAAPARITAGISLPLPHHHHLQHPRRVNFLVVVTMKPKRMMRYMSMTSISISISISNRPWYY